MYKIFILLILIFICLIIFKNDIMTFYNNFLNSIYKEKFKNSHNSNNSHNLNNSHNSNNSHNLNNLHNSNNSHNSKSVLNINKNNFNSNKGLTYFQNDTINQSDINENSYDIVNQIDKIDYGDVKTGIQKCNEQCKGVCLEYGYYGSATCYPKPKQSFDYGTLYKNPTFSYGTNAYKPKTSN
jgi:hypothetical protein